MYEFNNIPVYPYRRKTAKRWHQLKIWETSRSVNIICARELDTVLQHLDEANASSDEFFGQAISLLAKYGPERVMFLIAATVKHHQSNLTERPFTLKVRNWARNAWIAAPCDHAYILQSSGKAVMRFITACIRVEEM